MYIDSDLLKEITKGFPSSYDVIVDFKMFFTDFMNPMTTELDVQLNVDRIISTLDFMKHKGRHLVILYSEEECFGLTRFLSDYKSEYYKKYMKTYRERNNIDDERSLKIGIFNEILQDLKMKFIQVSDVTYINTEEVDEIRACKMYISETNDLRTQNFFVIYTNDEAFNQMYSENKVIPIKITRGIPTVLKEGYEWVYFECLRGYDKYSLPRVMGTTLIKNKIMPVVRETAGGIVSGKVINYSVIERINSLGFDENIFNKNWKALTGQYFE